MASVPKSAASIERVHGHVVADPGSRASWLALEDRALVGQCDVDLYRASGPGGQHRNKTESAVRLRHRPSGVTVHADERRSQHENRAQAVIRLRQALALEVREPQPAKAAAQSPALAALLARGPAAAGRATLEKASFWAAYAELFDVFYWHGGEVASAAAALGLSSAGLSKWLLVAPMCARATNELRAATGHRPLR